MMKYFTKIFVLSRCFFMLINIQVVIATPSLAPSSSSTAPTQDPAPVKKSTPEGLLKKVVVPAQIAVKVNNDVISYRDIEERISLVLLSSNNQSTAERDKVFSQVKNSLIQERLQKQLCKELKIHVAQSEVTEAVKSIAKDNNMTLDEMERMFKSKNVSIKTLEKRLEAQMSWVKVAQTVFSHQVNVSEQDAKDALEKLENKHSKVEYELSEIVMYVDSKAHEKQVLADMNNVQEELRKGTSIKAIAQQFSQSTSASKGGYIGWFSEGQRTKAEESAVKSIKIHGWTAPIKFNGGYRILFLHDVREPGKASQGETKVTYWTVNIPIEDLSSADQELVQYRVEELKNSVQDCDQFEKMIKKWGYKIDKPEPTSIRDLPDIWEKPFKTAKIGKVLDPINVGKSLILAIVCRKEAPGSLKKMTLQEVTNQLYSQKLEKIMTREFNKVMSIAFIEDLTTKKRQRDDQKLPTKKRQKVDENSAS